MELKKIFELIRNEDVVFWIGSGFSLYAGFPTGKSLAAKIYNSLSSSEKEDIEPNLNLMELAEQYVRLKAGSRNSLNRFLMAEFDRQPSSLKWHEMLAKIPHIKTIITTNYDQLFEKAYKENIYPVIFDTDIAYRDKRTELFKIHGDVKHPNTFIITRTDYTHFIAGTSKEKLMWSTIKERVSNKTILFIGYDLEDENARLLLEDLTNALGTNRKEIFLIAPGFRSHKINMLARNNIQYFDCKGEIFVDKLYKDIQDNVTDDFNNSRIGADTFQKFMEQHQINVKLKGNKNGFDIEGFQGMPGAKGSLSFALHNDRPVSTIFHQIVKGEKFGKVVMDNTVLKDLRFLINEINLIGKDPQDFKLVFSSKPVREGFASVVFDDGSEFEEIAFKIFRSRSEVEINAIYKNGNFKFSFDLENTFTNEQPNIHLTFEQTENFTTVNDAIAVCKLSLKLASGIGYSIYLNNNQKPFRLEGTTVDSLKENLAQHVWFYESLKAIEKSYQIRFSNLGSYSEEDFNKVEKLLVYADNNTNSQDCDGDFSFKWEKEWDIENLLKIQDNGELKIEVQAPELVTLYGVEINLGYLVIEFADVFIVNLEELQNKCTTTVILRSKSGKMVWSYSKTLPTILN